MNSIEWLENRIKVLIPEDIGSQLMFKSNIAKAKEMHKAEQETLYTEEQVREALSESFKASQEGYDITSDEIIQSLKPKKD